MRTCRGERRGVPFSQEIPAENSGEAPEMLILPVARAQTLIGDPAGIQSEFIENRTLLEGASTADSRFPAR